MTDDPRDDGLSTLLRDRVAGERTDLDVLVRAATTQGTRIRRHRRAAVAVGAAAGVVAVAGLGAAVAGGSTTNAEDAGFAAGPSSTAPSPVALPDVGSRIHLPSGAVATVLDPTLRAGGAVLVPDDDPRPVLLLQTPKSPSPTDRAYVERTYPGVRLVAHVVHPGHLRDTPPVALNAAGWSCEWYVEDDKGACTGPDGDVLSVVWRPAAEHDSFVSKTTSEGDDYFITAVHGPLFASVQPGAGVSQRELDQVGRSLTWVD